MPRKSVVAGQFYPGNKDDLEKTIKDFSPSNASKISAKAIILPHAGYVYSGKVAIATVSKVLARKRVLVLGPNHTGFGPTFSLYPQGSWQTPFGVVDIDKELHDAIMKSGDAIEVDTLAHEQEHSIEVELPILKYFFKEFTLIALTCMPSTMPAYEEVAEQLFLALKPFKDEIILAASTDLTHYEPEPTARKKDREAIEAIINLDADQLLNIVKKKNITMCGVAPVAILLKYLKKIGAKKAQVALYQTSGDACGDYSSVVGYAGIIIN